MSIKKATTMGIDVGGTKILLQTFDEEMKIIEEERVLTEKDRGKRGFLEQLYHLIELHLTPQIKRIGIALPGIVHHQKQVLIKAPHLPLTRSLPLKKLLESRFKKQVYIDNDINAFLWAAKEKPALKKYRHVVAVMVGTGVGSAVLVDGKLLYGASGYAGEVGHMILREEGALKTLEQNTSGSYAGKINQKLKVRRNDFADKKAEAYILEQLGIGLSNLNLLFNPEVMILGGSVYLNHLSKHKKKLEKMIATKSLDGKAPKLVEAGKGNSVALGVAMMAKNLTETEKSASLPVAFQKQK